MSLQALADVVLPLASLREQEGDTCWAYSSAHLLEARILKRDSVTVAFDIQKDYRFYQLEDRLLNSFIRKKPSEILLENGGYTGEFFYALGNHGYETFKFKGDLSVPASSHSGSGPKISTPIQTNDLGFSGEGTVRDLEKELIESKDLTLDAAKAKVEKTLSEAFHFVAPMSPTTLWPAGGASSDQTVSISVSQTFARSVDAESGVPATYSPFDFVLLFVKPDSDGLWFRFDDDRLIGLDKKSADDVLALVRLSLDRGWPAAIESEDHVATALGYRAAKELFGDGIVYSYLLADSSGALFPLGMSWVSQAKVESQMVGSLVYYPALKNELPARPAGGAGIPVGPSLTSEEGARSDWSSLFVPMALPSVHLPPKR